MSLLSLANKHFLKVADLAALEEDYYKSITNYERIARQSSQMTDERKRSQTKLNIEANRRHLAALAGGPDTRWRELWEERHWMPATYEEARRFGEPVFKLAERDRRGRFARRPAYRKS